MIEDYLLDRVVAVAEERHLSESTLAAYRRTWLNLSFGHHRELAWSSDGGTIVKTM
jgi:hypothetical protein